jgi:orotate phosphoribosyltransferase
MDSAELHRLLETTGALLRGHFVLRSGLHSDRYLQCALLLQDPGVAGRIGAALADLLRHCSPEAVISPALGGVLLGHEVARHLGVRHIFAEKEQGQLVLRRGFRIGEGERFVVVEDVVTRGGRVQETLAIVRQRGGITAAIGAILDRSGGERPDFGCPFHALAAIEFPVYPADGLPPALAALPVDHPGS